MVLRWGFLCGKWGIGLAIFFLDSGLVSRRLSSLIDATKIHSFTIDNAIQIGLICYLSVSVFRNQCSLANAQT